MPTMNGLTPNIERWLKRAMPADMPIPDRIVNSQRGEINIRENWTPFTAATRYQAVPFNFNWQARIRPMPLVWLQARDYHSGLSGGGSTRLWGLFSMGSREDSIAFHMQLVRSLAELPWMPPYARAIPGLKFQDDGDSAFTLLAQIADFEINLTFEQNQNGEVVRVHGQRHYDTPDGYILAPWQIIYEDYITLNGLLVPGRATAVYEKPEGRWEYWRGEILDLRLE